MVQLIVVNALFISVVNPFCFPLQNYLGTGKKLRQKAKLPWP
jgi:hypothetical protein